MGRVVAPDQGLTGPIGVGHPEAMPITEIAIDIVPTAVKNPPVRHQRHLVLVRRAAGDLMNVRAIGAHAKQLRHDLSIARNVLEIARGCENNAVVCQINCVHVADILSIRQPLLQTTLLRSKLNIQGGPADKAILPTLTSTPPPSNYPNAATIRAHQRNPRLKQLQFSVSSESTGLWLTRLMHACPAVYQ